MLFIPQTNFKISLAFLAAGLFFLAGLVWGTPAAGADKAVFQGTITAFKLNIRSAPARGADVVVVADKGDAVDVLEVKGGIGGWLQIRYEGKKGYVRNRPHYIRLTSLAPSIPKSAPVVPDPKLQKSMPQLENSEPGSGTAKKKIQPERTQAQKKAIARKIEQATKKVASFSQKEMEILDGLNEIDYALNQARVNARTLRRESSDLGSEIETIRERTRELGLSMDETRNYAGVRLNALYRMHMMGSLEMAGPPSSLFDFFVKQRSLKTVVASDFSLLDNQARDLEELARLEDDLKQQVDAKAVLEEELGLQIRIQEKESHKKAMILKEIQRKKKFSQAALASLEASAKALDQTLSSMGLRGSAALDDTSFVRQKGRLSIPVSGKIISRYGTARKGDYKSFTFQSGIDIKVERGEPVRSVFKGEVMFSQWLKGYGNLLIINHGDNYYTLYAHVEEVFKKKGERVSTGEVIATAGDTGSIKGLCLHFEVRHHGKPVNPIKWLKKGA
ncbi:MAG: peptidoglycan DD-metalloendopeptidase family protein [Desulfobacter sp.]|nr:peptidoglycan DD-metalloendopeptidase family protein [Desulfobacter sp.]